jgi:hypothetical protein
MKQGTSANFCTFLFLYNDKAIQSKQTNVGITFILGQKYKLDHANLLKWFQQQQILAKCHSEARIIMGRLFYKWLKQVSMWLYTI